MKPQVYLCRYPLAGTYRIVWNKRDALKLLKLAKEQKKTVRVFHMDAKYYRDNGPWDVPTFCHVADELGRNDT